MSQAVHSGRRGEIHLHTHNTTTRATKRARHAATKGAIQKEQTILAFLARQQIDFVPQVTERTEDSFTYEWIEGRHFKEVFNQADSATQRQLVLWLLERAYQLDIVGVVHGELIKPHTNILVTNRTGNPIVVIDFERGSLHDYSGKNMRSLAQWLQSQGFLSRKECISLRGLTTEHIRTRLHATLTRNDVPLKSIFP